MMIQDLVGVREVKAEHLGIAARFGQARVHVGAAELGTQGDHEAVYGGVLACLAADGVEMQHVAAPVLQGDVAQIRTLAEHTYTRRISELTEILGAHLSR